MLMRPLVGGMLIADVHWKGWNCRDGGTMIILVNYYEEGYSPEAIDEIVSVISFFIVM
jgi:hypothetical protein